VMRHCHERWASAEVDYGAAISPVDCANIVPSGRSTRDEHESGHDKLSDKALRRAACSRERPTSNSCRGLSGRRRPRWDCGRLRARGSSTCMCSLWSMGTTCMPPGRFWRLSTDVRFAPEAAVRSSCISDPAAHARLTKQHRARPLPTTLLASSCRRQRRSQNLAFKPRRSHGPNRSLLRSNQPSPPI
jgi:hypothetical protein